jgi:uncharacterized repeat protein (TIGR03803 family)
MTARFGRLTVVIGLAISLSGCGARTLPPSSAQAANLPFEHLALQGDRILYRFKGGPDGEGGYSNLLDLNGTLYGTTFRGGPTGYGTVFAVSTSGKKRTIYMFKGGTDGVLPQAGLVAVRGTLYGTTTSGGFYGGGTVFAVTPSGNEHVVHSFDGACYCDGQEPYAPLLAFQGAIFGTTYYGGKYTFGTVFEVTTNGKETVLYHFQGGNDGANPSAGLIAVNGVLYGTTNGTGYGSGAPWGTIFSINSPGHERVLYRFKGPPDGATPYGGLVDLKGTLYGTTVAGGTSGWGTVFSVRTSGKERVVHNFRGGAHDGRSPNAPLIAVNGKLYGTTSGGAGDYRCSNGCGAIFDVTPSGSERLLYGFRDNPDGANPFAGLTFANGALFGVTASGGYGYGAVFRVMP